MEETKLVGTEAVSRDGKFVFPDKTERYAMQRTKFEGDRPVIEIAEQENYEKIRFKMDGELFQMLIEAARILVSEFQLKFRPDGMQILFVDPAHVAMERIFMPREAFSDYDLGYRYLTISLDVDRLKDLRIKKSTGTITIGIGKLNCAKKEERVVINGLTHEFVSREYGTHEVFITFGSMERRFSTLDNDTLTVPRVPDIKAGNYVIVQTADMRAFLEQAARVSDSAKLILTEDGLELVSLSDTEEARVKLERDKLKEIRLADGSRIASSYPVEYLAKFFSAIRKPAEVRMSFNNDYPLQMEFSVRGMADISVVCLLAPRMEQ